MALEKYPLPTSTVRGKKEENTKQSQFNKKAACRDLASPSGFTILKMETWMSSNQRI